MMGYEPPPPPEWIEVTTMDDTERRFVPSFPSFPSPTPLGRWKSEEVDRSIANERDRLEVMRENRRGTMLLFATIAAAVVCIAQAVL